MPKYGPAFGMATNLSSSSSDVIISSSSSSHRMETSLLSPLMSIQSQTGTSSNQVIGSGTLAHKGNSLSAFFVGKKRKKPWIVDSGASDHMTGDATIFSTYSPCPNNLTVRIADGSLSKVAGTGSVVLSRDLTLNSVLLVPNLDCNLLSISKLTKEKRCITNFSSTHCEFQDLDSGKTIGNAEECYGLYILKEHHVHKNNLKWELVVILFRSHVKITIVQLGCGTIAWVILMLCISSIYFLHYLIKIQNPLSVKSVNYQSKFDLIFPFNPIKRLVHSQ